MARFAVDSPPEKPKMRRFKVKKLPGAPKKKYWGEIMTLFAIAVFLNHFSNLKETLFGSSCDTHLPAQLSLAIQESLTEKLFRQESVAQNISRILSLHSGLTALSFVGGCGTGKSYTAQLISDQYAEVDRHFFHWVDYGSTKEVDNAIALEDMILRLISCREQLLIVDNLTWRHKPYVEDIHRWMMNNSGLGKMNLMVIFIFNFETESQDQETKVDMESFHALSSMNFMNFKSFDTADGRDYLVQLRDKGIVDIDLEFLDEIVESLNVKQYGLKKLANRFLAYN